MILSLLFKIKTIIVSYVKDDPTELNSFFNYIMNYLLKLLIEAVVVGVSLAIIGTVTNKLVPHRFKVPLPDDCKKWNDKYVMQISLFITGATAHLLFEASGVNKWYCNSGAACLNFKN